MKVIKIAAVVASSFLIALFVVIFKVENPEIALYKETVEILMQQEGLNTEQELEEHFPILKNLQVHLDEITALNEFIVSRTSSPAPALTELEVRQLEHHVEKRYQLRKKVSIELKQLTAYYADNEP